MSRYLNRPPSPEVIDASPTFHPRFPIASETTLSASNRLKKLQDFNDNTLLLSGFSDSSSLPQNAQPGMAAVKQSAYHTKQRPSGSSPYVSSHSNSANDFQYRWPHESQPRPALSATTNTTTLPIEPHAEASHIQYSYDTTGNRSIAFPSQSLPVNTEIDNHFGAPLILHEIRNQDQPHDSAFIRNKIGAHNTTDYHSTTTNRPDGQRANDNQRPAATTTTTSCDDGTSFAIGTSFNGSEHISGFFCGSLKFLADQDPATSSTHGGGGGNGGGGGTSDTAMGSAQSTSLTGSSKLQSVTSSDGLSHINDDSSFLQRHHELFGSTPHATTTTTSSTIPSNKSDNFAEDQPIPNALSMMMMDATTSDIYNIDPTLTVDSCSSRTMSARTISDDDMLILLEKEKDSEAEDMPEPMTTLTPLPRQVSMAISNDISKDLQYMQPNDDDLQHGEHSIDGEPQIETGDAPIPMQRSPSPPLQSFHNESTNSSNTTTPASAPTSSAPDNDDNHNNDDDDPLPSSLALSQDFMHDDHEDPHHHHAQQRTAQSITPDLHSLESSLHDDNSFLVPLDINAGRHDNDEHENISQQSSSDSDADRHRGVRFRSFHEDDIMQYTPHESFLSPASLELEELDEMDTDAAYESNHDQPTQPSGTAPATTMVSHLPHRGTHPSPLHRNKDGVALPFPQPVIPPQINSSSSSSPSTVGDAMLQTATPTATPPPPSSSLSFSSSFSSFMSTIPSSVPSLEPMPTLPLDEDVHGDEHDVRGEHGDEHRAGMSHDSPLEHEEHHPTEPMQPIQARQHLLNDRFSPCPFNYQQSIDITVEQPSPPSPPSPASTKRGFHIINRNESVVMTSTLNDYDDDDDFSFAVDLPSDLEPEPEPTSSAAPRIQGNPTPHKQNKNNIDIPTSSFESPATHDESLEATHDDTWDQFSFFVSSQIIDSIEDQSSQQDKDGKDDKAGKDTPHSIGDQQTPPHTEKKASDDHTMKSSGDVVDLAAALESNMKDIDLLITPVKPTKKRTRKSSSIPSTTDKTEHDGESVSKKQKSSSSKRKGTATQDAPQIEMVNADDHMVILSSSPQMQPPSPSLSPSPPAILTTPTPPQSVQEQTTQPAAPSAKKKKSTKKELAKKEAPKKESTKKMDVTSTPDASGGVKKNNILQFLQKVPPPESSQSDKPQLRDMSSSSSSSLMDELDFSVNDLVFPDDQLPQPPPVVTKVSTKGRAKERSKPSSSPQPSNSQSDSPTASLGDPNNPNNDQREININASVVSIDLTALDEDGGAAHESVPHPQLNASMVNQSNIDNHEGAHRDDNTLLDAPVSMLDDFTFDIPIDLPTQLDAPTSDTIDVANHPSTPVAPPHVHPQHATKPTTASLIPPRTMSRTQTASIYDPKRVSTRCSVDLCDDPSSSMSNKQPPRRIPEASQSNENRNRHQHQHQHQHHTARTQPKNQPEDPFNDQNGDGNGNDDEEEDEDDVDDTPVYENFAIDFTTILYADSDELPPWDDTNSGELPPLSPIHSSLDVNDSERVDAASTMDNTSDGILQPSLPLSKKRSSFQVKAQQQDGSTLASSSTYTHPHTPHPNAPLSNTGSHSRAAIHSHDEHDPLDISFDVDLPEDLLPHNPAASSPTPGTRPLPLNNYRPQPPAPESGGEITRRATNPLSSSTASGRLPLIPRAEMNDLRKKDELIRQQQAQETDSVPAPAHHVIRSAMKSTSSLDKTPIATPIGKPSSSPAITSWLTPSNRTSTPQTATRALVQPLRQVGQNDHHSSIATQQVSRSKTHILGPFDPVSTPDAVVFDCLSDDTRTANSLLRASLMQAPLPPTMHQTAHRPPTSVYHAQQQHDDDDFFKNTEQTVYYSRKGKNRPRPNAPQRTVTVSLDNPPQQGPSLQNLTHSMSSIDNDDNSRWQRGPNPPPHGPPSQSVIAPQFTTSSAQSASFSSSSSSSPRSYNSSLSRAHSVSSIEPTTTRQSSTKRTAATTKRSSVNPLSSRPSRSSSYSDSIRDPATNRIHTDDDDDNDDNDNDNDDSDDFFAQTAQRRYTAGSRSLDSSHGLDSDEEGRGTEKKYNIPSTLKGRWATYHGVKTLVLSDGRKMTGARAMFLYTELDKRGQMAAKKASKKAKPKSKRTTSTTTATAASKKKTNKSGSTAKNATKKQSKTTQEKENSRQNTRSTTTTTTSSSSIDLDMDIDMDMGNTSSTTTSTTSRSKPITKKATTTKKATAKRKTSTATTTKAKKPSTTRTKKELSRKQQQSEPSSSTSTSTYSGLKLDGPTSLQDVLAKRKRG